MIRATHTWYNICSAWFLDIRISAYLFIWYKKGVSIQWTRILDWVTVYIQGYLNFKNDTNPAFLFKDHLSINVVQISKVFFTMHIRYG